MEKLHEYLPGDSRERIQDLLIERKMTQAQLAEKLESSESSLNRYQWSDRQAVHRKYCEDGSDLRGIYGLPAV